MTIHEIYSNSGKLLGWLDYDLSIFNSDLPIVQIPMCLAKDSYINNLTKKVPQTTKMYELVLKRERVKLQKQGREIKLTYLVLINDVYDSLDKFNNFIAFKGFNHDKN